MRQDLARSRRKFSIAPKSSQEPIEVAVTQSRIENGVNESNPVQNGSDTAKTPAAHDNSVRLIPSCSSASKFSDRVSSKYLPKSSNATSRALISPTAR